MTHCHVATVGGEEEEEEEEEVNIDY